jgi:hypothetical protein
MTLHERARSILAAAVDAKMCGHEAPPAADIAYAKSKRMIIAPATLTHDQILERTQHDDVVGRSLVTREPRTQRESIDELHAAISGSPAASDSASGHVTRFS